MRDDSIIANKIAEIYGRSDCRYGYRKVHDELVETGDIINKKKVQRIMKELGFEGIYPKKKCTTTTPNKEHKIYPYLLKDLKISSSNQVWANDITYIRLQDRFMYFIAIVDLYSRYIVEYGISHSLEGEFYVFILKKALDKGKPEIFNTDQGAQFTSNDFVQMLSENKIKISMDHKGRCFDNIFVERLWRAVKQEAIALSNNLAFQSCKLVCGTLYSALNSTADLIPVINSNANLAFKSASYCFLITIYYLHVI